MAIQRSQYRRKSSVSGAYPAVTKALPRRALRYLTLIAVIIVICLFLTLSKLNRVPEITSFHHTPVHKPPAQQDGTSPEKIWFSDLRWLSNPFSSTITDDDYRSVLPPRPQRPPVYTYYDAGAEKDQKIKASENKLLLIWRRAWWAQGFRPVVLGPSEAKSNPLYAKLQEKKFSAILKEDMLRWMAWGQMGTGILSNWLCVPMGPQDDPVISSLRKGKYAKLSGYDGIRQGLLYGNQDSINYAIKEALDSSDVQDLESVIEACSKDTIKFGTKPTSIAFYDTKVIADKYKSVSTQLSDDKANGLGSLAELITSHLHQTFLGEFKNGFAVLTPHARKTFTLSSYADALARSLRTCPATSVAQSCPPNNINCQTCSTDDLLPITGPEQYSESSSLYTIGTLPHPYTLASLLAKSRDLTTRYIRRDTERDRWLYTATKGILGPDISGPGRIVGLKQAIASEKGSARGFWLTPEQPPSHKDLEYHFGFALPELNITSDGPASINFPGPASDDHAAHRQKKLLIRDTKQQIELFESARKVVAQKLKDPKKPGTKEMVEAWNMADTEAWRFVRAYRTRSRQMREGWEAEERKFAGAEAKAGEGEGVWQWFDRA